MSSNPVGVNREIRGTFRFMPQKDDCDETVVLEQFGVIIVPKKVYEQAHDVAELCKRNFAIWYEKRMELVKELEKIAKTCDNTQFRSNIFNITGAVVGAVGGGLMIAGIAIPTLFIAGIPCVVLSGATSAATGIIKEVVLHLCTASVNDLVKKEEKMRNDAVETLKALQAELNKWKNDAFSTVENENTRVQKAIDALALLSSLPFVGIGITKAVLAKKLAMSANLLKGFGYGAGGAGVALDIAAATVTLVDLAGGSRSKAAENIRVLATALMKDAETLNDSYVHSIKQMS